MQAARAALDAELLVDGEPDAERVRELTEELAFLAEHSKGISPYVELYLSEVESLPGERGVSQASYLLVGSLVGALLMAFYLLLRPGPQSRTS